MLRTRKERMRKKENEAAAFLYARRTQPIMWWGIVEQVLSCTFGCAECGANTRTVRWNMPKTVDEIKKQARSASTYYAHRAFLAGVEWERRRNQEKQ